MNKLSGRSHLSFYQSVTVLKCLELYVEENLRCSTGSVIARLKSHEYILLYGSASRNY